MIVGVEAGKRRTFASALGWPGWTRSGRDEESAVAELVSYAGRYRPVVVRAGLAFDPDAGHLDVVERVAGNATTDFGAPGAVYAWDSGPVEPGEWERTAAIMKAAWEYFDEVVAGAPAVLRKGPRGGGRDRDAVAAHVVAADVDYRRKLGLDRYKPELASLDELKARREEVFGVFLVGGDGSAVTERGWSLRYAARRGVWHILDHAWEIEDKST
ncbi:MAG: hypothetical protein ACLPQS_01610 [Acidimicrobiales bacterium]